MEIAEAELCRHCQARAHPSRPKAIQCDRLLPSCPVSMEPWIVRNGCFDTHTYVYTGHTWAVPWPKHQGWSPARNSHWLGGSDTRALPWAPPSTLWVRAEPGEVLNTSPARASWRCWSVPCTPPTSPGTSRWLGPQTCTYLGSFREASLQPPRGPAPCPHRLGPGSAPLRLAMSVHGTEVPSISAFLVLETKKNRRQLSRVQHWAKERDAEVTELAFVAAGRDEDKHLRCCL